MSSTETSFKETFEAPNVAHHYKTKGVVIPFEILDSSNSRTPSFSQLKEILNVDLSRIITSDKVPQHKHKVEILEAFTNTDEFHVMEEGFRNLYKSCLGELKECDKEILKVKCVLKLSQMYEECLKKYSEELKKKCAKLEIENAILRESRTYKSSGTGTRKFSKVKKRYN